MFWVYFWVYLFWVGYVLHFIWFFERELFEVVVVRVFVWIVLVRLVLLCSLLLDRELYVVDLVDVLGMGGLVWVFMVYFDNGLYEWEVRMD